MTKQEQERSINRILITMAIAFGALVGMYYLYALVRPANDPVFWTLCGLFLVAAVLMAVLSSKKSKSVGLSFMEGYKKDLKARSKANFGIFFVVCAVLCAVCALTPNLKTTMVVIAWAIGVYTVALIIVSSVMQKVAESKVKKQKISKKAAQKNAKKALRNS